MYSTQKNTLNEPNKKISGYHGVQALSGGLRLEGKTKASNSIKPLISIVTVVFNGEKYLEETILSVLNQSYDNIEFIVIDAGSTDSTLTIIKEYDGAIDYWLSEPDDGIYDAMNKGARLSKGKYLHFLNAGDSYYTTAVLGNIYSVFKAKHSIVVGSAEFVYTKNQRVIKKARLNKFQMPNCHQSCFYLADDFKKIYYSNELDILADFNYWFKIFVIAKAEAKLIEEVICCYDMNGISNTKLSKASVEKLRIFYSQPQWRYRILGTVDVGLNLVRTLIGKGLQKLGVRAKVVKLKLMVFK